MAPAWSRDGTRIFYLSDADGFEDFVVHVVHDVHVMDADGSNREQLTHIADRVCSDCTIYGIPSWIAVSP